MKNQYNKDAVLMNLGIESKPIIIGELEDGCQEFETYYLILENGKIIFGGVYEKSSKINLILLAEVIERGVQELAMVNGLSYFNEIDEPIKLKACEILFLYNFNFDWRNKNHPVLLKDGFENMKAVLKDIINKL